MHLFADWFNFDSFNLIILISVIKTNWGSFVSTTRNSNFEWTLLLEVHGNDSFSNLRFHFDLHMCHSLSIKRPTRKFATEFVAFHQKFPFQQFIKQSVSVFFSYEKKKTIEKKKSRDLMRWNLTIIHSFAFVCVNLTIISSV